MKKLGLPGLVGVLITGLLLFSWSMQHPRHQTVDPAKQQAAMEAGEQREHAEAMQAGKPVPEFTATDIRGKTVSTSQYKGKMPLVVVVWTPKDMMSRGVYPVSMLAEAARSAEGKNVGFITIAYLSSTKRITELATKNGLTCPTIADNKGEIAPRFLVGLPMPMPMFYVIDKGGTVRKLMGCHKVSMNQLISDTADAAAGKFPPLPKMRMGLPPVLPAPATGAPH